jgi:hypothetical protein
MDYYEELGLNRSASDEQIRGVYKTLVRLLHPDGQTDEFARGIAEQQLKRLNGIVEILLHPAKRRRYDLSLEMPHAPFYPAFAPPMVITRRLTPLSALLLFGAGAVVAAGIEYAWNSGSQSPAATQNAFRADDGGRPTPSVNPVALVPATPSMPANRAHARSYPTGPVGAPPPRRIKPSPPVLLSSVSMRRFDVPQMVQAQTTVPTPTPESVLQPTPSPTPLDKLSQAAAMLNGAWLYAPQVDAPSSGMYAPEYVELYSKVAGGVVSGRFRSRYYVTNQPLSPEVNFVFRGPLSPSGLSGEWVAPDGSRGTIDLRLLPSGVLEVKWVRTTAGTERTLAYGKAILVKEMQ